MASSPAKISGQSFTDLLVVMMVLPFWYPHGPCVANAMRVSLDIETADTLGRLAPLSEVAALCTGLLTRSPKACPAADDDATTS